MAVSLFLAAGGAAAAQDAPPFPPGTKYGYINLQRVLAESSVGQTAGTRVQALTDTKLAEIQSRQTTLQTQIDSLTQQLANLQQRLEQGQNVMSAQARLSLQREISRLQLELQRQTQDAQAEMERVTQDADGEVAELRQELQLEFEQQLAPALDQVAAERQIDLIFNIEGLIWGLPALDLTQAVVQKLNSP
jgi:Skp family chaperone for outer membrane proteins